MLQIPRTSFYYILSFSYEIFMRIHLITDMGIKIQKIKLIKSLLTKSDYEEQVKIGNVKLILSCKDTDSELEILKFMYTNTMKYVVFKYMDLVHEDIIRKNNLLGLDTEMDEVIQQSNYNMLKVDSLTLLKSLTSYLERWNTTYKEIINNICKKEKISNLRIKPEAISKLDLLVIDVLHSRTTVKDIIKNYCQLIK